MCGFAGFLDRAGRCADVGATLESMGRTIAHRGPDDSGQWHEPSARVAFSFRRLSIQDLSPLGHQPMTSSSGRFTLAFNGEVYNFLELRAELESGGAAFRGHSDTEVMLAAFEAWGIRRSLERFVGMFAFAAWDRAERELTLARDRLGVKPLYYGLAGDGLLCEPGFEVTERDSLVFASELKPFRKFPGMRFDLDAGAIALFVRHAYVPTPHSIHRAIRKLAPGHLLRVKDGRATVERWWSAKATVEAAVADPFRGSDAEAIDAIESKLREAVRVRMIADVPLGAFLSGGIDSSAVVAAMTGCAPGLVRTFTIGVRDPTYDEAPFAKQIAAHLGTAHHEEYIEPQEAIDSIPNLPQIWDEPFADSSQIPTYLVSRIAKRHVTVILSGDGGDELFGGYYRYAWSRSLWRRMRHLPAWARSLGARALRALPAQGVNRLARPLMGLLPQRLRMNAPGDRAHKLASLLTAGDPWEIYHRLTSIVQEPAELLLASEEPRCPLTDPDWLAEVDDLETRMMQADVVSYLVDDILVKVDRASMAASLEAREPLLDHRLLELAFRLPGHLRIRDGVTKWALREVLHRKVPRHLFERPKQGFSIPIEQWTVGPLREWAESLLDERKLREGGVWRADAVRSLWAAQLRGGRHHHALWNVLMFQAWREAWPG